MKSNANRQYLMILALILFCSATVQAQKKLAAMDKAQIVAVIIKKENFFKYDKPSETQKKEVYFLTDNISSINLPKIENVDFVKLSKNQIEKSKKTGIEYYSFSRLKFVGKVVRVKFDMDYVNLDAEYATGESTTYKCRKVAGRWKIVAVGSSGYVNEKSGR